MSHHVLWLFRFHDLNINDSFVAWVNIFSISYPILLKSVAKHGSPHAIAIRTNTKYRNAPTNLQTTCIQISWDYFKPFHTPFLAEADGSQIFLENRIKPPANLHINWLVLTCILACDLSLHTEVSSFSLRMFLWLLIQQIKAQGQDVSLQQDVSLEANVGLLWVVV